MLIVDDEPLAWENLRCLLAQDDRLEVVGECANAVEAIGTIHRLHPDVVFLDIQMPRISGLEMVAMIDPDSMAYIVFVTAYDEYACGLSRNRRSIICSGRLTPSAWRRRCVT